MRSSLGSFWVISLYSTLTRFKISPDVHASGHQDEAAALVAVEANAVDASLPVGSRLLDPGDNLGVVVLDVPSSLVQIGQCCW